MRFQEGNDGIERTPEYYDFLTQLQQFHDAVGTTLQQEPILGGKKLDLYRIYLGVKAAGGFEKVSEEHGWQKIANPFEFPPTCTNSAYVIKRAYKANLYNFVQVKDHNASIESIRVAEQAKKQNEEAVAKKGKARAADVPVHTTNFVAPQRGNGAPIKVDEFARDEKYLMGGFQNKILLALQSGLPNEVDWGFNKLVKISYTCPPNFHVGTISGLLDIMLTYVDPFFDVLKLNTALDNFETSPDYTRPDVSKLPHFSELTLFNSKESALLIERVLQFLHIIRNFSFMDHNLKFFIQQHAILTIVAKALALPSYSLFTSLKHHSLDIFENLSVAINLRGRNDFYLACLRKIVIESSDRALLLGSLRSLTRLCGTEANHTHLFDLDQHILERAFQLLRVKGDDELVYSVLEFLYMYSCLTGDAVPKIVTAASPSNIVAVMLEYLHLRRAEMGPPPKRVRIVHQQAAAVAPAPAANNPPPKAAPATGTVTPAKATPVVSAAPSPALPKAVATPLKQTAVLSAAPSPVTPNKKGHVNDEEEEEIDIDGDDDDDDFVLEQGKGKPPGKKQTGPATTGSAAKPATAQPVAPSFMDVFNAAQNNKKRGRPRKYQAEIDAYSIQLAQQLQQQQTLALQQNPNMSYQEQQALTMQLQQQHNNMMNVFMNSKQAIVGSVMGASGGPVATPTQYEEEDEEPEEEIIVISDPSFECHWHEAGGKECPLKFGSEKEIAKHMAEAHFSHDGWYMCRWMGCTAFHTTPGTKAAVFRHARTHVGDSSKKQRVSASGAQLLFKKAFKSGGVGAPDLIGIPLTALLVLRNVARSAAMKDLFLPYEAEIVTAMAERPKLSKILAEMMYELR
ncbi:AT-rich interactive domain-containing protein 2 [Rhizoclosmatium sp. JEL0117]|nr:AT-rich interactive domain-containing protein 2 [Rhizoclosmatium sp. JEL0117]